MINISENGEAIFEPIDGIIKQSDFTEEQRILIKSISSNNATKIDCDAFRNFKNLEKVSFPKVEVIGECSFFKCENLKEIYFPITLKIKEEAFVMCENLIDIDFQLADFIGNSAFDRCTNLKNIKFPKVKTICEFAFTGCSSLEDITFEKATEIKNHAFQFCNKLHKINVPEINTIYKETFSECPNLTEIHTSNEDKCALIYTYLPNINNNTIELYNGTEPFSVEKLESDITIEPENNIISGTKLDPKTKLATTILSITAKEVDPFAFCECKKLTELDLSKVEIIHETSMNNCEKLYKIKLPEIKEINGHSCSLFSGCTNLSEIYTTSREKCELIYEHLANEIINRITNNETNLFYGEEMFYPELPSEDTTITLNNIEIDNEILPKIRTATKISSESAKKVKQNAFVNLENLEDINLTNVTQLEKHSFVNCPNLNKINIPNIETIDYEFIVDCKRLQEIYTTTKDKCEIIYWALDYDMKEKISIGELTLFYEGENIYNPIERNLEKLAEILNPYLDNLKTDDENIKEDKCPICDRQLKEINENDFVCTIHDDHQVHRLCLIEIIKYNQIMCPLCGENLNIPDKAIDIIEDLNTHFNK